MTEQLACGTCGKGIFLHSDGTVFPRGIKTHVNIQHDPPKTYFCNDVCKNSWLNDMIEKTNKKLNSKKWRWH